MIQNLTDLSRKLTRGSLKSADLVQEALSRISDPAGQGACCPPASEEQPAGVEARGNTQACC